MKPFMVLLAVLIPVAGIPVNTCHAQGGAVFNERIDSLKNQLAKTAEGPDKFKLYGEISWEYIVKSDYALGLQYADSIRLAAQRLKDEEGIAYSRFYYGVSRAWSKSRIYFIFGMETTPFLTSTNSKRTIGNTNKVLSCKIIRRIEFISEFFSNGFRLLRISTDSLKHFVEACRIDGADQHGLFHRIVFECMRAAAFGNPDQVTCTRQLTAIFSIKIKGALGYVKQFFRLIMCMRWGTGAGGNRHFNHGVSPLCFLARNHDPVLPLCNIQYGAFITFSNFWFLHC